MEEFTCAIDLVPVADTGAVTAAGSVYGPDAIAKWLVNSDTDPATAVRLWTRCCLLVPAASLRAVADSVKQGAMPFYMLAVPPSVALSRTLSLASLQEAADVIAKYFAADREWHAPPSWVTDTLDVLSGSSSAVTTATATEPLVLQILLASFVTCSDQVVTPAVYAAAKRLLEKGSPTPGAVLQRVHHVANAYTLLVQVRALVTGPCLPYYEWVMHETLGAITKLLASSSIHPAYAMSGLQTLCFLASVREVSKRLMTEAAYLVRALYARCDGLGFTTAMLFHRASHFTTDQGNLACHDHLEPHVGFVWALLLDHKGRCPSTVDACLRFLVSLNCNTTKDFPEAVKWVLGVVRAHATIPEVALFAVGILHNAAAAGMPGVVDAVSTILATPGAAAAMANVLQFPYEVLMVLNRANDPAKAASTLAIAGTMLRARVNDTTDTHHAAVVSGMYADLIRDMVAQCKDAMDVDTVLAVVEDVYRAPAPVPGWAAQHALALLSALAQTERGALGATRLLPWVLSADIARTCMPDPLALIVRVVQFDACVPAVVALFESLVDVVCDAPHTARHLQVSFDIVRKVGGHVPSKSPAADKYMDAVLRTMADDAHWSDESFIRGCCMCFNKLCHWTSADIKRVGSGDPGILRAFICLLACEGRKTPCIECIPLVTDHLRWAVAVEGTSGSASAMVCVKFFTRLSGHGVWHVEDAIVELIAQAADMYGGTLEPKLVLGFLDILGSRVGTATKVRYWDRLVRLDLGPHFRENPAIAEFFACVVTDLACALSCSALVASVHLLAPVCLFETVKILLRASGRPDLASMRPGWQSPLSRVLLAVAGATPARPDPSIRADLKTICRNLAAGIARLELLVPPGSALEQFMQLSTRDFLGADMAVAE